MPRPSIRQRFANWLAGGETRSDFPGGSGLASPGGFGPSTLAGAAINDRTALSIAAVWSAVSCYVNTIGSLDFYIAEREERGGRVPATWHPSYDAVRFKPNRKNNAMRLKQAWIGHACTRGNGYLEIEWDQSGRYPRAFHLLDPRHIKPVEVNDEVVYRQTQGGDDIPACDVLHLAMFGWDGIKGYSPIEVGRETLGVAASQRDYQAGLFVNSAQAQGHLEVAGTLNKVEQAQLRKFWNKIHQGPRNAGNVGILEGGMKWVQTNFSPQDAQLILGCKFSVEEVARFWNLPQHKLNLLDNANFSTVEEMNLDFYTTSILPWLKAIEIEYDTKIFSRADRNSYSTYHDFKGLLRGNLAAQTAQETADLTSGVRSLNEVRKDRGDNPIEDPRADYHWIAVNNLQALETMASAETPAEAPTPGVAAEAVADVQATALNGAQIASLLSIAQQIAAGMLPMDSGKGMIAASFPSLSPAQIDAIVSSLGGFKPPGAVDPPASPAPPSLASLREVVADPLGRMFRREAQAARRASKRNELEAWAATYYTAHLDVVAEAIGPAIRAVGTLTGRSIDPAEVAARLVVDSRQQLRDLVVCVPPDELPDAVDRLCSRWEADRAGLVVDSILPLPVAEATRP